MFEDDVEDYFVEQDSPSPATNQAPSHEEQEEMRGGRVIAFGETPKEGVEAHESAEGTQQPVSEHSKRKFSWIVKVALVAMLIGGMWGYFRYFSPVIDSAVMDVYVDDVHRRGVLFKTYEASLKEENQLINVSIVDESIFLQLQSHQDSGKEIRVGYCRYSATLPWRGESEIVITEILSQ